MNQEVKDTDFVISALNLTMGKKGDQFNSPQNGTVTAGGKKKLKL